MALDVLVVDDSPVTRMLIQRLIQVSGLPVRSCTTAADGRAALSVLRGQPISLILTDLCMPEMGGEELIREMQNDAGLRDIPFIVVSTDGTATRMQQMLDLGASGYVVKPFMATTLRSELNRVVESSDARN